MDISTLIRFLLGQRQAIVDIVNCRAALWVGAIFVLSAGFAREYNQEDLLHTPWYLIIPLVASLATSLVLYSLFFLGARQNDTEPLRFWPFYRRFLTLYWMTAPLAWLYAIPVESLLSAADSVRANLSLLGLVSLWRVLLISRCASVLFGSSFLAAFFIVMFFADTLALVILYFTPLPIFNIMGGIPLTESESVIREIASLVQFFGVVSWPIWLICALVVITSAKGWQPLPLMLGETPKISLPLWSLAILSVALWVIVLPMTQPAQQLRRRAESDLQNGLVKEALKRMSAHERRDYPPHWDPPPWPGYGQDNPTLVLLMQMLDESTAVWVTDTYFEKFKLRIGRAAPSVYYYWEEMDSNEFSAYMTILEETPRGQEIVRENATLFRNLASHDTSRKPERTNRIRELLKKLDISMKESVR